MAFPRQITSVPVGRMRAALGIRNIELRNRGRRLGYATLTLRNGADSLKQGPLTLHASMNQKCRKTL